MQQHVTKDNFTQFRKPPISSDFCTYNNFPLFKYQIYMKETRSEDVEESLKNTPWQLHNIPKNRVPGMLQSMETTLDKMCGFRCGLRSKLNSEFIYTVVFFLLIHYRFFGVRYRICVLTSFC